MRRCLSRSRSKVTRCRSSTTSRAASGSWPKGTPERARVTLDEMLAREAIRATMARYTNAGDKADYEDLVPCYAEDGVFEFSAGRWEGREAIGNALRSLAQARG